jgi:hypothetical protein
MPSGFDPVFADMVRTFTTTTGTGAITPGAAVDGHRTFDDALSSGDRFYYSIEGVTDPSEWEVGRGELQGDGTITRDPLASSNGGALVNLSAGTKTIALTVATTLLIKAGKLKAYASLGSFRFAGLPDLPTMRELGYKNVDLNYWHMLVGPAGTPRPAIERLNAALKAALEDTAVDKLFVAGGMVSFPPEERTPEAASAYLKDEIKRWGDVIRANKIVVEQ